jgi:hypothetical protein
MSTAMVPSEKGRLSSMRTSPSSSSRKRSWASVGVANAHIHAHDRALKLTCDVLARGAGALLRISAPAIKQSTELAAGC